MGAIPSVCEICKLPLDEDQAVPGGTSTLRPHEASLAHQVCLEHSHPPSALDRSRMGMGVLQSQGWDPDSRQGLGAAHQGIQFPLKAKPKRDTMGIGVEVPKDFVPKKKEKTQTYDAKKVRKMVAEDRKRQEKLREQIFAHFGTLQPSPSRSASAGGNSTRTPGIGKPTGCRFRRISAAPRLTAMWYREMLVDNVRAAAGGSGDGILKTFWWLAGDMIINRAVTEAINRVFQRVCGSAGIRIPGVLEVTDSKYAPSFDALLQGQPLRARYLRVSRAPR
ncbi:hypothetical protein SLS62_007568 [Diatrype stigma]|uniref:G-patch domain-containing protein n=1 Tax=Diatrype stigma TaxID=117547 RepID=A0AAN9UL57_9PEZI